MPIACAVGMVRADGLGRVGAEDGVPARCRVPLD